MTTRGPGPLTLSATSHRLHAPRPPRLHPRGFRWLEAIVLLVFVAATQHLHAATAADYFPVIPGSEWRYASGPFQVIRRVAASPITFHGVSAFGFRSTVNGEFIDTYWWSASNGLRVHRIDDGESALPAGIRFQQPVSYTPADLAAGATHSFSSAYGYANDGMAEPFNYEGTLRGNTRISGPETVSTPAGSFACLRVAFDEVWSELGEIVYENSTTLWLAAGVGLVKVSDASGASLELQSFTIPGGGPPSITGQPAGRKFTPGTQVTLTVQASGTAPLTYQWRKDGRDIPGATQASLAFPSASPSDAGGYSVEVTGPGGKTISATAQLTLDDTTPAPRPSITSSRLLTGGELEITFTAAQGKLWQFEASDDLRVWTALPGVSADGSGTRSLGPTANAGPGRRFFRMREGAAVPTDLTLPVPGQLYPGGTRLGGDLFGFEFTIAPKWKGGLRVNSPWMLFGSDTEPGLILGLLGFSGTREQLLQDPSLRDGFESAIDPNNKLFFRAVRPIAAGAGNRLSAEFAATGSDGAGYAMSLEFLVHPNGGFLGFLGLTTPERIGGLKTQLLEFVDASRTPERATHQEYLNALPGRSFKWESGGIEWYSGNWQGSASSTSWSESYAFFCADGRFEINKQSTSYVSSSSSGGWSGTHMSLSYDSTTKEYGQFTVIQHPQHGSLMLIATLAGYQIAPVQFQPDGSLLLGKNRLVPHQAFNCAGP